MKSSDATLENKNALLIIDDPSAQQTSWRQRAVDQSERLDCNHIIFTIEFILMRIIFFPTSLIMKIEIRCKASKNKMHIDFFIWKNL